MQAYAFVYLQILKPSKDPFALVLFILKEAGSNYSSNVHQLSLICIGFPRSNKRELVCNGACVNRLATECKPEVIYMCRLIDRFIIPLKHI